MTQAYLKTLLTYDPLTGQFTWLRKLSNRVRAGDLAGSYTSRYGIISINGKRYKAHNLAWLYMTGKFPIHEIDHKDQNSKNNMFINLRDITPTENARNKPKRRDNLSGITGVSWDKINNKWVVRIKDDHGKYINRGRFATLSEAECARNSAIVEFGYSKTHGQSLSRLPYRQK